MRCFGYLFVFSATLYGLTLQATAQPTPPLEGVLRSVGTPTSVTPTDSLNSVLAEVRRETSAEEADSIFDQGHSKSDRRTTAAIRRAIIGNSYFSRAAKNIAIITRKGIVTLIGTVESHRERMALVEVAEEIVGGPNVDNELRIR